MQLSIIVPVYNMTGGGKLNYCLDSLLAQKLTDYEIIAVDDKSTDNSLAVLRDYEAKYPDRIKVIASPENKRQGGAKNLGLAQAKGDYIGFIDSDDWVSEDMFLKLLEKASETGADIVGCDYLITDETGKEEGTPEQNNKASQTGVLDDEKYKELILAPGSMVIKIYRRELFFDHKIVFPEKMFYEDNAIAVLPFLYAKRFERVEECLYFYYQHNTSTVHTVNMDRCRDRVKAMQIYKEQCTERGFYSRFKEEIDYKVYELGYRNTLFSYIQATKWPSYGFVSQLRKFLRRQVPDLKNNKYFEKLADKETQKLVGLHLKSNLLFLGYYKALTIYRKLRYG